MSKTILVGLDGSPRQPKVLEQLNLGSEGMARKTFLSRLQGEIVEREGLPENDLVVLRTVRPTDGSDQTHHITSYDPGTGFPDPPSWYDNRVQDARQVFYLVNNFHDWLEQAPIGVPRDDVTGTQTEAEPFTSNQRYDAMGRVTGTIAPFSS